MEDRRKSRRMELESKLIIKGLNGSSDEEVAIEVADVSMTGIGFTCESQLAIGSVYEAYLTIWMKEHMHIFLEIIRMEKLEGGRYYYGAIFIGMPVMDSKRIEVYDTMDRMENTDTADSTDNMSSPDSSDDMENENNTEN